MIVSSKMPLMTVLLFATSLICCQLQRPSHWCDILFTLHSVPANRCATRKSFGILGKVDIFCVITCMCMMCTQLNWGVHLTLFFAPVKRLPWSIEVSGLEFYQMSCKCRQAVLLQLYAWLNIQPHRVQFFVCLPGTQTAPCMYGLRLYVFDCICMWCIC